ncbi:hypothetical protein KDD93_03280 [Campylobacter sp. faydin G-24]|uniref:PEGA domain-containing protein n=1 Tax=Campylobacter anatolicus TaxID=2829105 RepID=A0ABS5HH38_9BACT|nr:hypothetical protein [Campylobacter anatolicus]MBR8461860.1 hypothetical protein [Campylobacter anatolicus]MBR8463594.1 hypothetical protein [Campylobacter anatolicus]
MIKFKLFLVGALALVLSGCASIVNGGSEKYTIHSDPSAAKIVVIDKADDTKIYEGITPLSVTLEKHQKYFKGKTYNVSVMKDGYAPVSFNIRPTLSGWYIGNIIFGGLIGILIVDPLTGGMWNLAPEKADNITTQKESITIKLLSDTTANERANMTQIK